MSTIPASQLVAVNPSVLAAGGSGVEILGLVLTANTRVPIGSVLSFPDGQSVTDYFGPDTVEDIAANGGTGLGSGYFGGFSNSTKKPSSILFAQYNSAAVSAYLRGGDISGYTTSQLQAISGTLSIVIDGITKSGSPNLSAATSFSLAAQIIADALDIEGLEGAVFTGAIAATTLTVSAFTSGTPLAVGHFIEGAGVTAGTYITALGSGTGGTGTYTVSASQSVGSEAMTTDLPGISYDSVSGGLVVTSETTGATSTIAYATGTIADDLKLQAAQGAVLSQGAAAGVPATFMNALIVVNSNWVSFMTTFNPDNSGFTAKEAFAAWKNSQNNRFLYVCWDLDQTPTNTLPATASLGYALANNNDSGTCLLDGVTADGWDVNPAVAEAAFVMGSAASISFDERRGRITFAYKESEGLNASVTDPTVATNLGGNPQSGSRGNGYNFYGAYGAANPPNDVWFQRGFVTGDFAWLDSYVNQVWMNTRFQRALLDLLRNSRSIPYGSDGNALIENALAESISQALNFGAFGPGALTAAQQALVNGSAGKVVAPTLQSQGYYLQILPSSPTVRAARTSPPCKFWYIDRGSVQAITLSSVALT
jgi:hypothetical protein